MTRIKVEYGVTVSMPHYENVKITFGLEKDIPDGADPYSEMELELSRLAEKADRRRGLTFVDNVNQNHEMMSDP